MTIKKLIRHQVCWVESLLEFNFAIFYISNKENQKVNLLTQNPNDFLSDYNNDC